MSLTALLPAWSVVVCEVELTLAPWPARIWSAGQLATPESASLQVNLTITSPLYQPAAFGLLVAAALMVGAVRSMATVTTLLGALVLPARSLTVWALELA